MFATKKILGAALVAATLVTSVAATTAPALAGPHHHHGNAWGWGVGGFATGLVLGSALAPRPAYAETVYVEPVRRCEIVDRVNRHGEVIGTRKICRYE